MQRIGAIVGLALALAACGQGSNPPPSSTPAPAPAQVALTPEEISAAVTALPAPFNAGDYEAGKRVFAQCRSCHTIDSSETNRVGPHLHGVIGRQVASVEGFTYSEAMRTQDFIWDGARLDPYLANPLADIPGNRMAFAGVRDATQRQNLITYLMVESAR